MATPPAVDLTLGRGQPIRLRLAVPEDRAALEAGFAHLSDDARYTRFFTAMPKLSGRMLGHLTDLDGQYRLAIAAFDPSRPSEVGSDDGFGVAVARFIRPADDQSGRAELAISIIDEYHGVGLGTVLMTSLVMAAQRNGLAVLGAYVLRTNRGMTQLLRRFGAAEVAIDSPEASVAYYELAVATALDAAEVGPSLVRALEPILAE